MSEVITRLIYHREPDNLSFGCFRLNVAEGYRIVKNRGELLNEGIKAFYEALQEDELALSRVDAAVNVGGPSRFRKFSWVGQTQLISGRSAISFYDTPLGSAMELAIDSIEAQNNFERKCIFTRNPGFILADGDPTDPGEKWVQLRQRSEPRRMER